MKLSRFAQIGALGAVAALALTACAANEPSGTPSGDASASTLEGTLNATGASSQDAAQQAWVAAFQTANPGVTINYQATGSGVGRDNFLAGGQSYIGSDRAFNEEEIAAGGFGSCTSDAIVEVPAYISPVAVIFNLEGVESLNLDAATIAKIFNGDITTWNDPAIADLNTDVTLPDTAISPVHRSDPSGTSDIFTGYLEAVAPEAWPHEASDEWPLASGEAAQGTSGVVAAVKGGAGTIGYADASQARDLGTVAIKVGDEFVSYSSEAAAALVEASPLVEGRGEGDLVFDVDPAAAPAGSYPIALVSYLIGCEAYEDEATAELVREYFSYVVSAEGQDVAQEAAGSAPLSDNLREQINAAISLIG
ncbi:phosphate ABC transporter substrate-binding protein PstS [Microbacterium sp. W1N]|uniref:phosphate ABC transporter substrate-binding protein PstS n=1 Tax=Microbacterium festucae TaxID=2977531 RepID=UPI0021BE0019|nr:phosphate ABC transporter substrate-binding protein PstS [Microbacterium festucae]MCT9821048.1 phosphate ABC transporter substrate-binding protein PstS [Microbacterium festucae]